MQLKQDFNLIGSSIVLLLISPTWQWTIYKEYCIEYFVWTFVMFDFGQVRVKSNRDIVRKCFNIGKKKDSVIWTMLWTKWHEIYQEGIFLLDPSPIIAVPCQSLSHLLNFVQIVGIVNIYTWISPFFCLESPTFLAKSDIFIPMVVRITDMQRTYESART